MKLETSLLRSARTVLGLALLLGTFATAPVCAGVVLERRPPDAFTRINGDANGDWTVDLADIVYLLEWSFSGGPDPVAVYCRFPLVENGDANGDGARDVSDVVYFLAWKFSGGPDPVASCGEPDGADRTLSEGNGDSEPDGRPEAEELPEEDGRPDAEPVVERHAAVQRKGIARVAPARYEVEPVLPLVPILPEVRILDLNIAGVAIQNGQDISAYILYKIGQLSANVVTLQEICSVQASGILAVLPGWSMFFKKNTTDEGCGGSQKFGLATFVKGEFSDPEWWELPHSNPRYGWSKYLTKIHWRGYNIYNTHIRAFGGDVVRNTAQFEFVVDQLEGPLVLAGDFNAEGRTIPGLEEIDADQERTFKDRKIDYVFTTGTPIWGDAQDSVSDHRILKGIIR